MYLVHSRGITYIQESRLQLLECIRAVRYAMYVDY
jgi:hypothetical protein